MKAITNPALVANLKKLVDEMTVAKVTYEREFDPAWMRGHQWRVVPAESEYSHFSQQEIERVVPVLKGAGYTGALAVATEPLDPLPECYEMRISEDDFHNFNQECGLLRYLLMDHEPSWAISCYGAYKLLAGPEQLLEKLLGVSISVARKNFLEFVHTLDGGNPESPMLKMALRCADT